MNEKSNYQNKEEIITNDDKKCSNNLFDKLCNIQKLLKKESSLINLCKIILISFLEIIFS